MMIEMRREPDPTRDHEAQMQALYGPAPYGWRSALQLLALAAAMLLIACAGAGAFS